MQEDNLDSFIQKVLELKQEKEKESQLFSESELDNIARELEIDPAEIKNKAQEHYIKGKHFIEFNNYKDARKELEEAVILHPNHQEVLISLALVFQHLWQTSQEDDLRLQAIHYAEQVIKINPQEKDAYKIISYLKYEESSVGKKVTPTISSSKKVSSQNNLYKLQSSIRVFWFGSYYDAVITKIQDGKYKINYPGYDNKSDEWISEYRILGSPSNQVFKWLVRGILILIVLGGVYYIAGRTVISNKTNISVPDRSRNVPLKVGDKVTVLWKSSYYEAEILEISGNQYKIHYSGYDSNWDEWITSERIK